MSGVWTKLTDTKVQVITEVTSVLDVNDLKNQKISLQKQIDDNTVRLQKSTESINESNRLLNIQIADIQSQLDQAASIGVVPNN